MNSGGTRVRSARSVTAIPATFSLTFILVVLTVLPSFGQTGRKVPPANSDSIKALMRALDRRDTSALRRYGLVPRPGAKPRIANLAMLARSSPDSIVLRWAPAKPGAWLEANRYGYLLERVTMGKDGKAVPGSLRRLAASPMKPWTLDEWKARAPRNDRFAAVAAQSLYGKSFKESSDAPSGVAMHNGVVELEGRFGFALFAADNDPLVATGLALRYVDREVRAGEQYVYRLHLAVKDTSYHVDTAYAAASPVAEEPPPPPPNVTAEGFDRHITLRWDENPPGRAFSGYNVYRSDDGGKSYRQLNENPIVTPYRVGAREKLLPNYTDTTVVNYVKYHYRVRGITPFAELSKPADIEAWGTDRTPPPRPILLQPKQTGRNRVTLTWQMPDTARDIAGYIVSRSAQNLEGYAPISARVPSGEPSRKKGAKNAPGMETATLMKQLLPPSARTYVDDAASSAEPYYMVGAVDTAGNLSQSLPAYAAIIDSVPPRTPTGLAGTIDTNGVVHLHWHLGPEPNIIGYRVLWANDPRHEFTMRTPRPVKDTVFADTVNIHTLTHYIYYRIAAVNDRFIHSPLTPILALRRPDVVPPGAPQFINVSVSDSAVMLAWANSSSDNVKNQRLYRRKPGEGAWTMLASLPSRENSFTDRKVSRGEMYEYSLEAVDSSGLRSSLALPVQGRPYDTGMRAGISDLRAALDAKGKSVRLTWTYRPAFKERYWFVIYRSFGADGLTQYQSVDSRAHTFEDHDFIGGGTYRYAVRVMTEKGGRSPLSQPQPVLVK